MRNEGKGGTKVGCQAWMTEGCWVNHTEFCQDKKYQSDCLRKDIDHVFDFFSIRNKI